MTSILIIAHAPLASALKAVADHAYPASATPLVALDAPPQASVEQVEAAARELLAPLAGEPVLVFVDAFGATPSNAAIKLLDRPQTRVVAGLNVPMLWRTLCYGTKDSLDVLVARAVAGATQGVLQATAPRPQNQGQKTAAHGQDDHHDQ